MKMSASYDVQGYVDVRIQIDNTYDTCQGVSTQMIADLVKWRVESSIGNCEILNHLLQIKEIG
jgi:hypothetical protein